MSRHELKQRYAAAMNKQQEDLVRQINALRRGDLPADYAEDSLADDITQWQVTQGLVDDSDREGLSIGQKKMLFDAGMKHANPDEYAEGTVWGPDGIAYQPGMMPGTWEPARPIIRDVDDFKMADREARSWQQASASLWAQYRVFHPEDDAATVQQAVQALRQAGNMSLSDLNAIANDPESRSAAFARIHEAVYQLERYAPNPADYAGDDEPAYVLGGSVGRGTGTGTSEEWHRGYQKGMPARRSSDDPKHPAGSLSGDMEAMQRKMGLRQ